MAVPATSANFGDLLEPGLFEILVSQYNQLEQMRPLLFDVRSSNTSFEQSSSIGGLGDMQPWRGTIHYDDAFQGEDVTWTHKEYSLGFKIERRLFDDDLYNVIAEEPRKLAISASRTMEKLGASVFNDSFIGAGTIVVDSTTVLNNTEGQSLCSTAHSSGSGKISDTFSNSGVLPLSPTNIETTRQDMAEFVDDTGNLIQVIPDLIVVPRAKEQDAWEIIATKGQVDTANNNSNFHFGRYKLAVWDHLTSGTAWWMADSVLMRQSLKWWDRIPLEFFQAKDFDTLVAKFAVYARWSWGWRDWRWLFGHNATS